MRSLFLLIVFFTFSSLFFAQDIAIGNWKDHLSYNVGVSVAEGNGKVYCLTKGGVIVFNKSDNSVNRLSKVNGLSDIEPTALNFNGNNNKLIIAYKNSNIDIVESNNTIINMVDIKINSITGSKTINNIYFINQFAYLSCAFGIVVIDMDRYEVKDTYIIGTGGNKLNVRSVSSDVSYLYAATDSGVYKASINSPDLANFAEWQLMPGLPSGIYNSVVSLNGKTYANFSNYLKNGVKQQDTVFVFENVWSHFGTVNSTVNSLNVSNNSLIIAYNNSLSVYDANKNLLSQYTTYFDKSAQPQNAVIDSDNNLWIADTYFGLVSNKNGAGFEYRYPNGPFGSNVNEMSLTDEHLWVAPGLADTTSYANGLYSFVNNDWSNVNGNYPSIINFDTIYNINHVLVNPQNTDAVYAASANGLVEFNKGVPLKLYNNSNSSLQVFTTPVLDTILIGGMAVDASNNLWVANSNTPACISIKSTDGTWQALNFSGILGNSPKLGQVLIDNSNQLWVIVSGIGIMVYNGNGAPPNAGNTKLLTTTVGNGALPVSQVYCMTQDSDGKIWVGTQTGIAVFYNPQAVFTGQNFDAQQIFVQQDGNTEILLLTEIIQAIAVDGANRKWIATQNSGVFLMSADGLQQVSYFSETNSPLFSDNVKSIAIDQKTGEVYFGTAKGIVSYRGTATQGNDDFTNVYAFPNPVKPEYQGIITVKGLMENSTVKFTDINGTLVFETLSQGGQAIWNGKNFKGDKVSSGVYMVFCTSQDGSKKVATKILFVN